MNALDALLQERNVRRAAERCGVTQSAMSHALRQLRAAVQARPGFDAQTSTRRFSIACSDAVAVTLIPELARDLWRAAPGVGLELRPSGVERIPELLETGELD